MIGSVIPDKSILICTLPILVVLEKDRLGGCGSRAEDVDNGIT